MCFFPQAWSWRRQSLAPCADRVALSREGHPVPAPRTSGGSVAMAMARAARRSPGLRRPRNISVPSYRPLHSSGCTPACASEAQARGMGRTCSPATALAVSTRAGADVRSQRRAAGQRPLCSSAFATQCHRHASARLFRRIPHASREVSGAPAPLLTHSGERAASHTPWRVGTSRRRRGRASGHGP